MYPLQKDVVVVSIHPSLDLQKAPSSHSLLKEAGLGLQQELKLKYPKGVNTGTIIEAKGHKAKWKKAYLMSLPLWKGRGEDVKKVFDTYEGKPI